MIFKKKTKEKDVGLVWRIQKTFGLNFKVYTPYQSFSTVKFYWLHDAEEFVKAHMNENDVIGYY